MINLKAYILQAISALGRGAGEPSPTLALTRAPSGTEHLVAVREGYSVTKFPAPTKHRRKHTFTDLQDFADWLDRHADPGATEILLDAGKVRAALSPADAYGDIVTCVLVEHPRFSAWDALFDSAVDQRMFYRAIVSHRGDFLPTSDRDGNSIGSFAEILAPQVAKLGVTREGTLSAELGVTREGTLSAELDERGSYRYTAQTDKTQVAGSLPSSFVLRTPLYQGVGPRPDGSECLYDIEVFLSLEIVGGKAVFVLSTPGLDLVRAAALADVVAYLRHLLPPEFLVGQGDLAVETVPDVSAAD